MTDHDIFDTVARLRGEGRPFCVATVVRTADVTSAKAGAKAAITEDGAVVGHLGGGCVLRAVRTAATQALARGATTVIRVKPSEKVVSLTDEDGAQVFRSGCPSGGTVEVLIEPYAPPPMLVVFGTSPIAKALAAHGALMGFRLAVSREIDPEAAFPLDGSDLPPLSARDFVVVASQGAGDLAALRAALQSPARRVSMVASRRKAETLSGKLAAEGLSPERLARLKSPAGLDLGGIDPHEIALSVLAEIVAWRAADKRALAGDDAERA